MRKRKIRGYRRRHRHIDRWRDYNLSIDLNDYLLNQRDGYYAKIRVHPWSSLPMRGSVIPQSTGETKQKMLSALLDIYDNWKAQLDTLDQPYYLKIWLFEPRFSQSQVVCAIGGRIDFYRDNFYKADSTRELKAVSYGNLTQRMEKLSWDHRLDEDHYDNDTVGEADLYATIQDYEENKRWFVKLMKKPHRTVKFKEPVGNATEAYSFRRGDLWVGGEK